MEDDLVFIHIPKTAGSSFRELLCGLFSSDRVSSSFPVFEVTEAEAKILRQFKVISGHTSWADIQRHFQDRKLLTVLRDPVDRCISWYYFTRSRYLENAIPLNRITYTNNPKQAPQKVISLAKLMDIDDFLQINHPHILKNIENRMVWQLAHYAIYERRNLNPEVALRLSMRNLDKMHFVGLYEELDEDIRRFLRSVGVSESYTLPRVNSTRNRAKSSDLSLKTISILRRLNELDYQLYKYALR